MAREIGFLPKSDLDLAANSYFQISIFNVFGCGYMLKVSGDSLNFLDSSVHFTLCYLWISKCKCRVCLQKDTEGHYPELAEEVKLEELEVTKVLLNLSIQNNPQNFNLDKRSKWLQNELNPPQFWTKPSTQGLDAYLDSLWLESRL